jgi:hypothetical protein
MALLNNQTTKDSSSRHRSGSMSVEDEMMFVRGRVFQDDDDVSYLRSDDLVMLEYTHFS